MDYTVFVWIAIVPAVVVLQIYLLGLKMSEPEKMMRPIKTGLTPFQKQALEKYMPWLNSVNLSCCTSFQFGSIQAVVFQQGDLPRYLSFMFHKRLTFAAESYLGDLTILDTSNSGSLGLFPRPGAYAQSLPGLPPEQLWEKHLEGEAQLTKKFGYRWVPLHRSYEDLVIPAMRVRMAYNRSQLFWPFRVLCRYAWTRHRIRNRTIAQQFP